MSELQGVLFDLGGTLLEYVQDHETWDQVEGRGITALYPLLVEHGCQMEAVAFRQLLLDRILAAWQQATGGLATPSLRALVETLAGELGLPLRDGLVARAVGAYCASIVHVARPYPGAAEVLAQLKALGLRLGLVSNTLWEADVHRRDLERFGLLGYFDDLVFSSECGRWKPNAEVFAFALQRLGLQARAAVFVGDRLVDDVGGAQAAGLKGVLRELPREENDYERGGQMGIRPDGRIRHLEELPPLLEQLGNGWIASTEWRRARYE